MRRNEPCVPAEAVYEAVYFHEIEQAMNACLSEQERLALWEYAERPKRKPSKRVVQAIRRVRTELRISD